MRVAAGLAYVHEQVSEAWSPLADRVRAELDPAGKLSA